MTRSLFPGVGALLLAACGAAPEPRYGALSEQLFVPRCAVAGCHDDGTAAGGLVLTRERGRAMLVGVPVGAAAATGWRRVEPGDPDRSFLVRKLYPPVPLSWGLPMPSDGTVLDEPSREAVVEWVRRGARDD